jgi:PAS domain S-box-containing protein
MGVPLATEDGTVFGCFFVMDPRPRRWTPEQVEILQDLAASVMTEVELRLDQVERARTEAALRASERRLRTQVELSTDGILLLDERGAILDCNSAALTLFGYGREELLGRSMAELNPPERLPLLPRTFDAAVERRALEWMHRRRDGTLFPSELTTRLYEAEGERRVVVYVRDLTERMRAERERAAAQAHYGRLVATIPMGVYVLDARASPYTSSRGRIQMRSKAGLM